MLNADRPPRLLRRSVALGLAGLLASGVCAEEVANPAGALERAIAIAEGQLRSGDFTLAARHYREALLEGWRLMGAILRLEGRLPEAREAYRHALPLAEDQRPTLQSLAFAFVRIGAPDQAVEILTRLAEEGPPDPETLRLLAMALAADGHPEEALRRLDEASATEPDDPQQLFLLATEYLWLRRPDRAERLFARVLEARPIPQTHVLIGRAYRDASEYERARAELRAALRQDPNVRRAHYYLGMVILSEAATDPTRLEKAEPEFRAELDIAPRDPLANDQLGIVLLEAGRPAEALPFLETAAREEARSRYLQDLGRGQLALDRPAEGAASLRRALELAVEERAGDAELERIHYQLGRALRMLGQKEEAATHLAEAGRLRASRRDASLEEGARSVDADRWPLDEIAALADLTPPERAELESRVRAGLARAYFNLGVLETQDPDVADASDRFVRAASFFESAAEVDPDFPQVQVSLGVAYFNAGRFAEAVDPLTRAVAADPANAGLRRMLALSSINTRAWEEAARLLKDDPELDSDDSLRAAYALALVRCRRGAEAEKVLTSLLADQGASAELRVLLGQAYTQQEKYDLAIESLERALELDPGAAEAHRTLGVAFLRQGHLEKAEAALRAELAGRPSDLRARLLLTAVLDARGRTDEAVEMARGVLAADPESAEALYLLGRMLLAQGAATEAAERLEAAKRLTPDDPNVRSQLGQAYETLGRTERAREELEASRRLEARQ